MRTYTPARPAAPAPSTHRRRRFHFEPPPIDPATRKRRIRIARAVNLICRTKCDRTIAARACGLGDDRKALQDIRELCNFRKVPRRHNGVVRLPETPSRVFEEFIPRQEPVLRNTDLAEMFTELTAVADPLGDDGGETANRWQFENSSVTEDFPKPPMICTCTVCGRTFESKQRRARYCGGRCRIRHWRAQQ